MLATALCCREQRAQAQAPRSTLTRTLTRQVGEAVHPPPSTLASTRTLQPSPTAHQADEALLKQHYKVSSCGP